MSKVIDNSNEYVIINEENNQEEILDKSELSYHIGGFNPSIVATPSAGITSMMELNKTNKIPDNIVSEFLKCRENPFYFIFNYCNFSEIGGSQLYKSELMNLKYKRVIKCINRFHKVILMASRQLGKALSLDTPILTVDNGFMDLRDIHPGMIIYDENYNPTTVIAESPIYTNKKCFKIYFSNNDTIVASIDHLWTIKEYNEPVNTGKLLEYFKFGRKIIINGPIIKGVKQPDISIDNVVELGNVPCKCIMVDSPNKLFLCGKNLTPTHNSTLAACILAHSLTFFPGNRCIILNMDMGAGLENVSKVRTILQNLPSWMHFLPQGSKTKTFLELTNGSKLQVIFPSTIKSPSQLGRSLTIPILYLDELAFIRHADEIWSSAQSTLATARQQAASHGYPYYVLITSTPNGTTGTGQMFFDYWRNAVDSDLIFERLPESINEKNNNLVLEKFKENCEKTVEDPIHNSFVRVKFRWDEDPRRDAKWYQTQRQELNFNTRKVAQEIDIEFTGSQFCVFSDETLSRMNNNAKPPFYSIEMKYNTALDIYKEFLDPNDYYIIGVDTAQNMGGAESNECALEIFSFKNFEQVGELHCRIGSYDKWGSIVEAVTLWLLNKVGPRIIVGIENNTIGMATLEKILRNPDSNDDITSLLYFEKEKIDAHGSVKEYGIKTTGI